MRTSILEDLDAYPSTGTRTPTTPSITKSLLTLQVDSAVHYYEDSVY
ncbi:hypothetical protein [Cryobacterium sp. TMT4-31]|nr:hypothetical protein [Cryobacterium sp. TMT4-31]